MSCQSVAFGLVLHERFPDRSLFPGRYIVLEKRQPGFWTMEFKAYTVWLGEWELKCGRD